MVHVLYKGSYTSVCPGGTQKIMTQARTALISDSFVHTADWLLARQLPGNLCLHRVLHRSILVAIGLSVGYETRHPIGWHHAFVIVGLIIDWDRLVPHYIMDSRDQWEFSPFFRLQWQSLCTALTAGKCLSLGPCKGLWKSLLLTG